MAHESCSRIQYLKTIENLKQQQYKIWTAYLIDDKDN